MDVCHVNDQLYLTLVDCGPSQYAIWRRLRRQDSDSIIAQLESIFLERGAPKELLTDNYTSFRSASFHEFCSRWRVKVRYRLRADHVLSGNGISERNHRTIKITAARKGCSAAEAVYRYNVMPRSDDPTSSPADTLFRCKLRVPDVDNESVTEGCDHAMFKVGDRVWIRDQSRRCDVPSSVGTVTGIVSVQCVEVDCILRHVRDLRPAIVPNCDSGQDVPRRRDYSDDEGGPIMFYERVSGPRADDAQREADATERGPVGLRRSMRQRRPAVPSQYGDL